MHRRAAYDPAAVAYDHIARGIRPYGQNHRMP